VKGVKIVVIKPLNIQSFLERLSTKLYVYQGYGRKSRIATVETAILDNPSAANYEELGELYWDEKEYAKAQEA
jgi:hypothetical protein